MATRGNPNIQVVQYDPLPVQPPQAIRVTPSVNNDPNIGGNSQPSTATHQPKTASKRRRPIHERPKKRRKATPHKPWSYGNTSSDALKRCVDPSVGLFGGSFSHYLKLHEISAMYHQPRHHIESDDSDTEENVGEDVLLSAHIGADLDDTYAAAGNHLAQKTTKLVSLDKRDMDEYGITDDETQPHNAIRKAVLAQLAIMKVPSYQFAEALAAQFGIGYTVNDFIWVLPQDIHELASKDPLLKPGQTYTVTDLLEEVFKAFAVASGKQADAYTLLNTVVTILDLLRPKTPQRSPMRTQHRSPPASPTVRSPSPAPQRKTGTPTKLHKSPTITPPSSPEQTEEQTSPTITTSATAVTTTTATAGIAQADTKQAILHQNFQLLTTHWKDELKKLFQGEMTSAEFFNTSTETPISLLVFKPIVRGMIRAVHSKIRTEAMKDFSLDELMYSPDVSEYFAKFIAQSQALNSLTQGTLGYGMSNMQKSIPQIGSNQGCINIYAKTPTKFNYAFHGINNEDALSYFKLVRRVVGPNGVTMLKYFPPSDQYESTVGFTDQMQLGNLSGKSRGFIDI